MNHNFFLLQLYQSFHYYRNVKLNLKIEVSNLARSILNIILHNIPGVKIHLFKIYHTALLLCKLKNILNCFHLFKIHQDFHHLI